MKYINFNNVKIQNFLSVGNIPVEVDFKRGLHIITGVNKDKEDRRNGVGKSTIADAIYFAVFGETLRDLKKEHIINNVNRKNCEVTIDVTIKLFDKVENIIIRRTLEPSKCYITIDGEDKTRDSITNTNAFIMQKFNCTPDIFQNCVIMTINNTIPFMAKKKQEKRKFIEDIFNLGVFSNMLGILKNDITEKKRVFDVESARYEEGVKTLNNYEYQQQKTLQDRRDKHKKYIDRKQNNASEIDEINIKINNFIQKSTDTIEQNIVDHQAVAIKLDKALQDIRHKKSEKLTLINQVEKQLKNIIDGKDSCPTCLRVIKDQDKEYIANEKLKLNISIDDHNNDIESYGTKETQIISKQSEIRQKIKDYEGQIHTIALEEKDKINSKVKVLGEAFKNKESKRKIYVGKIISVNKDKYEIFFKDDNETYMVKENFII